MTRGQGRTSRTGDLPVETPEDEAESGVRIETQDDLARRVELAGEFDGTTDRCAARVRDLDASEHAGGRNAEVQVAEALAGRRPEER